MLRKLISLIHHFQSILPAGTAMRLSLCLTLASLFVTTANAAEPASPKSPVGVLIADEITCLRIEAEIASAQTSNFTNPFNGKDLTGWGYLNKNQQETVFESFDGKTD